MAVGERVVVVGAGVAGLTTAVVLAEAGASVHVIAEQVPGVTSLAAGAMWGPYLVEPKDKVDQWGKRSLAVFRELAESPSTGVRLTSGIEASRTAEAPPDWAITLPGFRPCDPAELPAGFSAGYRFTVPLIDMPTYLGYLLHRLGAAGGTVERLRLASLADVGPATVTVNCTGLGAKDLLPDPSLRPIRGQHVVVTNPGLTEFFSEDTGLSPDLLCIYPHGDTVVLGGTAIDGEGDLAPNGKATADILARCTQVEPRLAEAHFLEDRIGARPTRATVRVEAERAEDGTVLAHNYGHGGAGVTLSWGCAEEIGALLSAT
ncbi:FAD-dependent oxidoreductase [Streptomyces acidiscabies]|uniref:D-amino-acid oxidase n=1 Tax=Streptomyces acidiscabies TaxID=42234 RepID=A0AAP6BKT9_9ACTN|nr:FAD-dependent oxidoreductase [Streptomyces acidiscabies]MBZ3908912.1 FAD-binding oxidoreductase [Streptomyces acidiscabies]MDX2966582.1 FAD-dependent oxidoreductase [Streptomyces acidiscabies]MDX3016681.1 FAD-dependent oxidoreductase [Streptomyces acidiscabies]MDX3788411.1 FAD-dependent oxidoreductase [Streptomyces acidiscabies]